MEMDFISLSFFTRNLFCQSVEKQYLRIIKSNVISSFLYFNHKSILVISSPHNPSQHMNCGWHFWRFTQENITIKCTIDILTSLI